MEECAFICVSVYLCWGVTLCMLHLMWVYVCLIGDIVVFSICL